MIPIKVNPDFEPEETLESYLEMWPDKLDNIPKCVIEQWCYRHNEIFIESWEKYHPENWTFELVDFVNNEIMQIDHLDGELDHYDYVGEKFISQPSTRGFLANYMLENGTFPQPIIVAVDGGNIEHPRSHPGEHMKEPYHLIEGHNRLGILRTMIRKKIETSQSHKIWLMRFNA